MECQEYNKEPKELERGVLYVVPTPVGNLSDITMRALEVLRDVDYILAEDTRTSGRLLKHFDIVTPLLSHHKYNEHETCEAFASRIAGFMLSRECRRQGVKVICLPGATAFVPALVDSGLPCDRFHFEGFLPPKKGRRSRLALLAEMQETFVVYESPLRLARTLADLAEACGAERAASVSREISKIHETTYRDTLGNLVSLFASNQPKGECVIIVEGDTTARNQPKEDKYKEFKRKQYL